jgi:L-fuconolactonase
MQIVDSQVHIWGAETPERPWPGRGKRHREVPVGKDEMLREMDAAGVRSAIIVPPSWEGDRNDLGLAAARAHPGRFALMGRIDPDAADARAQIAHWRDAPGMLGLRFTFSTAAFLAQLTEGRLDWLWRDAEALHIPIYVMVRYDTMHWIDAVARRHPDLKLVLDHLAITSGLKDDAAFRGFETVLAMAKHSNVAVKASALPCYSSEPYPFRGLHQHIRRVYDAFGPRRVFWGSDVTRLPCSYKQCVTLFTEEMPWLTADDLNWIMGRGVCEWLGWTI